jgi:phosphoserine phosphatase
MSANCSGGRDRGTAGGSVESQGQRTLAAFFDIDGTLVPKPSLERRLMRFLYWRKEWTPGSFARWVTRYLKVCALPSGTPWENRWVLATHGNKTFWKHVRFGAAMEFGERGPRIDFFVEGTRRMQWHASQRHKIFLVSGTLEVLAQFAAEELREELRAGASRSDLLPDAIGVCATRLAEIGGRWSGEVSGEAVWGNQKVREVERLAREHGLDLSRSFAYANSASDCGMLARVGHPMAVNPDRGLRRVAEAHGWPIVLWKRDQIEKKPEQMPKIAGDRRTEWRRPIPRKQF